MAVGYALGTCDALVAALNAHTFDSVFTAVRKIQPVVALEQLSDLTVYVTPFMGQELQPAGHTRNSLLRQVMPSVIIAQRMPEAESEEDGPFEPLLDLVDQVIDFLGLDAARQLQFSRGGSDYVASQLMPISNSPLFDEQKMREENCFESVITAPYCVEEY